MPDQVREGTISPCPCRGKAEEGASFTENPAGSLRSETLMATGPRLAFLVAVGTWDFQFAHAMADQRHAWSTSTTRGSPRAQSQRCDTRSPSGRNGVGDVSSNARQPTPKNEFTVCIPFAAPTTRWFDVGISCTCNIRGQRPHFIQRASLESASNRPDIIRTHPLKVKVSVPFMSALDADPTRT